MIGSRWKKVWADFWSNRGRTFLTIVTIAVGAFAVGFNSNLGLYMNESMDIDYLSANPSEAEVYDYPLNDDMVKMAREVQGVDTVEGFSSVSARIVRPDGTYENINLTAIEDPSQLTLNTLKPALGETIIPTYGEKETILDASALSLGYKPGDTIVRVDPRYYRPTEVETLLGDPTKAREKLGWTPKISLAELIHEMVAADVAEARRDALVKSAGFQTFDHHE